MITPFWHHVLLNLKTVLGCGALVFIAASCAGGFIDNDISEGKREEWGGGWSKIITTSFIFIILYSISYIFIPK